ncbi:MAG: ATP-binding cassette domain-containing protein [Pseudomonadota bacterium]
MACMLVANDLRLVNGRTVSLTADRGVPLAIMGASGSGKSLMLRALADLDPAPGDVSLDGTSREAMPAPCWRSRVCYVQAEAGWWEETVADHLSRPHLPLADRLHLDPARLTAPRRELSSGERARAALLRALLAEPDALLLDEPTGPLDPDTTLAVEAVLRDWAQTRVLVFSTHDVGQPDRLGAHVMHLT